MPSLRYSTYKVEIECPYNAELVDKLKLHIPPKSREWSPEKRQWVVFTPYMTTARNLVLGFYPNTVEYNREAFDAAESTKSEDEPKRERRTRAEWASGGSKAHGESEEYEYFFGADGTVYRRNKKTGHTESGYDPGNQSRGEYKSNYDEDFRERFRQQYGDFGGFNFGGGNYRRETGQDRERAQQTQRATHFDVLFITPSAPEQVARAAYKALAILHHPDKGGDTETMQKINRAFDEVKKAKGWK